MYGSHNYGRPWPAVYIIFVQITHQIQVLTEPLCRALAIFYALQNNERGIKYRGLTYRAKQNCPWICRATFSARQTCLRIWSVSITVVQSIETPQTTPKPPNHYRTPHPHRVRHWHSARIHVIGLNDRQLFWKANTCICKGRIVA